MYLERPHSLCSNFQSSERFLLQAYGLNLGEVGIQEAIPSHGTLRTARTLHPRLLTLVYGLGGRRPATEETKCSVELKKLQLRFESRKSQV